VCRLGLIPQFDAGAYILDFILKLDDVIFLVIEIQ
jgi:hypothetical protein